MRNMVLLNTSVLIEALQQEGLEDIRQAASMIRANLFQPENALRSEGTTAFDQEYLISALDQIAASHTAERAQYYLGRLRKSISAVKTSKVNDINLNRWKEYPDISTDSLWVIGKRDRSGAHSASYWGNFIPQIPAQMIQRYTKKGDWVIDPFLGSGTTLIEAQRLGRNALGIELQEEVADSARLLITTDTKAAVIDDDSTTVDYAAALEEHGATSAQLVIMHPPYFDIIKFSDDPRDLSNALSVESFLHMMSLVVGNVAPVLDKGRYLVLVIGDKYVKGEWIPLGFQTMNEVLKYGFTLKSIVVKNFEDTTAKRTQKELWRYRALAGGFYLFKHEYIFIFKKR